MATLDQLPAEQRAIVELVVQRGRSYDALADVLQVPADRVRELARDALSELSPRTARRVDPEWRGRVADYLLGQQAAGEASGTRDYLKRSETARAWALSLLDSLDPLYANGEQPAVPDPDGDEADEPVATPAPEAAAPTRARVRPERDEPAADSVEERVRARKPARERARKAEPERKREPLRKPAAARDEEDRPRARAESLSPAAQEALRRRRIRGAGAGIVLLVVIVVGILALSGAFSSDKKGSSKTAGTGTGATTTASQQPIQVLGQIPLNPIGKVNAKGLAYIVQQGSSRFLVVQAQVPPLPATQKAAAYEVWLYNSNSDARSLGAQYTNAQGILQGRANLPADFTKFKSVDISRELFDKNANHGNDSVLRGAFASLQPVPPQQQGAGTTTTPQGGTPTPPQGGTPTSP
jgi:hypothetical protein